MPRTRNTLLRAAAAAAVLATSNAPQPAAAASVLIWPIDPQIDAGSKATELWLENQGNADVVLQARVLKWSQADGADSFAAQSEVVASPPIVRIPAKARQLVRLIATGPARQQGEQAFRVLLDEIPAVMDHAEAEKTRSGIRFRMRYSLPLFIHGTDSIGATVPAGVKPDNLTCRIGSDGRTLAITNSGNVHARLTDLTVAQGQSSMPLASGQLGYVLPGSTMEWKLPRDGDADGEYRLSANLHGKTVRFGVCGGG